MRTAQPEETESIAFHSAIQKNSRRCSAVRLFGYGLLAILFAAGGASAQTVTATIAAGSQPQAVAVNPVTNKTYIVNNGSANVTVIDGASNAASTVAVGINPVAIAVNPVTNKIYVANSGANFVSVNSTVTVIDGATNTTATVAVGSRPQAVAVNPVTNKIYVTNAAGSSVSVIDGASNTTATVLVGSTPTAIVVNPVSNKIYVANRNSATVTVIDGTSNMTTNIVVREGPYALAVNPVTNKIYMLHLSGANLTVIDGASDTIFAYVQLNFVPPFEFAVNPVTNKIYVANSSVNSVDVIDGASNTITATVATGNRPTAVGLNEVTNQIYVTNSNSNSLTLINGATNTTSTLATGSNPTAVGVNPITNKVYVANTGSANVSVIDGATNATARVGVGNFPDAVAVNAATNKIYVANQVSGTVSVIDGAANSTADVTVGARPADVAVNPVTNKIYVAKPGSNGDGNVNSDGSLTVIDGVSDTVIVTLAEGGGPFGLAVNPVTNKIYAVNAFRDTVTVFDGASDTITTAAVAVGINPVAIAVNPITNKIYVANSGANIGSVNSTVTVIDGANNTTTTVAVGSFPVAVAVNTVTNKIYIANKVSGTVTVIDGAANTTATVAVGLSPIALVVNPFTNKIYVANSGPAIQTSPPQGVSVSVIDGASDTITTTAALGSFPLAVAVNLVTNKIYVTTSGPVTAGGGSVTVIDGTTDTITAAVAVGDLPASVIVNPVSNHIYMVDKASNDVTVLTEQKVQPIPLLTKITPLTGNQTTSRTPSFSFQTSSTYAPITPTPIAVYFQVDTWQGPWTRASGSNPAFSGQTGTLSLGTHILFAYASDGQDAGINGDPLGGQATIGQIAAYPFALMQDSTSTTLTADVNPSVVGGTVTLTATVTAIAPGTPTGTVTFLDGTTPLGTGLLNASGVATFTSSALTAGTHSLTAQYGGDTNFAANTSAVLSQVVEGTTTTVLSPLSAASYGTAVLFTATVAGSGGTPSGTVTFLDGTTTLGTGTLNGNGVATFTTSTLAVGAHLITAKYNGSANFAGSTSAPVTEAITQAATSAALVSSAASASSGATVTFTATISSSASGTPTGTVTFLDGTTTLGTGTLNSSGVATFTTSTLTVGTHSITAAYGGDSNFAAKTSAAVTETITPAVTTATTTALVSSAASASSGAPVTFTATVKSSTTGTPTGTVTFLDGAITLGTGTLNGSGVATFTTSTLTVGTHSITAAYGGDAKFTASTSPMLSQVVVAPSFTISATPSSVAVSAGNSASYQIMVTGKNNFSSAVTLSCTAGLPSGASCAFSPVTATPGTAPATSTLMISTKPHTTALLLPLSGGRKARPFAVWLLVSTIALGFLGLRVPRRRLRLGYALAFLLAGCVMWQAGCTAKVSGGTTGGTPVGTYPITVTGASSTGQQTTSVTLIVN